ncbi:MAG: hypothetical protein WBB85_16840 [Albidovulum sp.]|uniref:hypothetical protein n=1 Tax=Albidovulum sp. TaxID=1872424 RepID=UPI003CA219DC
MAHLSTEETPLVEGTQDALGGGKAALRVIAKNMRKLAKINLDAGRIPASAAAHDLEGAAHECLGRLIRAHAAAMVALEREYDDGGIVTRGGGGGR